MIDDNENAAPDPWAELGEGDGNDEKGEFDFSFDSFPAPESDAIDDFAALTPENGPVDSPESVGDRFSPEQSSPHESVAPGDAFVPVDENSAAAEAGSAIEPASESTSEVQPDADELFDDIADWLSAPAPETDAVRSPDASELNSDSLASGSSIQIGTGESGLVAEGGSLPLSGEFGSADGGEEPPEWPLAEGWSVEPAADGAETGSDGIGIDAAAVAGFAAIAVAGGAAPEGSSPATVVPSRSAAVRTARKSGGALGAIIGGLLSVPVVLLILLGVFWGTGRDPIGFRSWLPSFLLPSSARQVAIATMPRIDASPSLDSLSQDVPESVEPVMDESAAVDEPPSPESTLSDGITDTEEMVESDPEVSTVPMLDDVPDVAIATPRVDDLAPPVAPALEDEPVIEKPLVVADEPPSLDFSSLESAVESAVASTDTVLAAKTDWPDRRRQLVAWYKDLAKVGEELAMLETAATDSGRPLSETPPPVRDLYGRIAAADTVAADLKRLCRNWVDFAKRPADGVMLVGEFVSTRQVGPYWHSAVAIEQADGVPREVGVISRRAPQAEVGDRTIVAGVVFSGDVVWAADCSRLEAAVGGDEPPF